MAQGQRQIGIVICQLGELGGGAGEQARLLAAHARRLDAKVNLIPYNTVEGLTWERPSEARQQEFVRTVRAGGVVATILREKGHDIDAACGQLRLRVEDELAAAS